MKKKIIIGSRGSKLALIYADRVKKELLKFLSNFDDDQIEIKIIVTEGDKIQDKRLSDLGGKGLFFNKHRRRTHQKKLILQCML